MPDNFVSNKRIAKNTLYMYIRMFLTMLIGLYTSRVILKTLGVDDYGLYNVVGGIVTMFTFINGTMINATTRYITFYLGKGDDNMLNVVFNMASVIHLVIGITIVVLGETVGLWFLTNKMQIPEGRMIACHFLLQFSILTTFLSTVSVPYSSCVIAHEKMSTFAFISVLDVILRLLVVISLQWITADKLIVYGLLLACLSVFDLLLYFAYCKIHFAETKLKRLWDKSIFREMFSFAGWGVFGNFSYVFYTQGVNILLNVFCGPAVNAARAIAVQVEGVIKQFANNVQTAINPQIIKSYATDDIDRTYSLIFASAKYCFYLLFFLSLPLIIEADFVLGIWLGDYPEHTVNFIRIILITALLDAFINPMFTANLASGKIRIYQIGVFSVSFVFMFITYVVISTTKISESVFVTYFVSCLIGTFVRLIVLKKQIGLQPLRFVKMVLLPVLRVVLISIVLPVVICCVMEGSLTRFLVTGVLCVICVSLAVYLVGLNQNEREFAISKIRSILSNKMQW